jgi:hypothetical protein
MKCTSQITTQSPALPPASCPDLDPDLDPTDTASRIGKNRTGPDLDERPVSIQYVTEPSDCCGKINPFLTDSLRPNR